jgi:hypothetical protein
MYAATQFSGDDLPDSIFLKPFDSSAIFPAGYTGQEIFRNGSIYGPIDFGPFVQSVELLTDWEGFGPKWAFKENADVIFATDCLFEEVFDQESNSFLLGSATPAQDMFLDSYRITAYSDFAGEASATVTRTRLCIWDGFDSEGNVNSDEYLVFADGPLGGDAGGPDAFGWLPAVAEARSTTKQGNQNTPVGTYNATWFGQPAIIEVE